MKHLFYIGIITLLCSCTKNETPPQTCYTCTRTLTYVSFDPKVTAPSGNTAVTELCGEISKAAYLDLNNMTDISRPVSSYLVARCVAKP